MKKIKEEKIKLFISYSWDDEPHKNWVLKLAKALKDDGIHVILDRIHLKPGMYTTAFMEKAIEVSDVVLIIMTPGYKKKADDRKGGAGYEYYIINENLYETLENNEKFIPVLRIGDKKSAIPIFLKPITYHDMCNDSHFKKNVSELIKHIRKTSITIEELLETKEAKKTKQMKTPPQDKTKYQSLEKLERVIKTNFDKYFDRIFGIDAPKEKFTPGGAKLIVKTKEKDKANAIKTEIESWEKEVKKYSNEMQEVFSPKNIKIYADIADDFKNKIFKSKLWTVGSALRTPDPDLIRYKRDYGDALPEEILNTLKGILQKTDKYVKKISSDLDYSSVQSPEVLKMDYLDDKDLSLSGVIGFGIRSEILHRYYPAYFPVMTQRTIWGMYFLSALAEEFVTIEQKSAKGIMRVSHNWIYNYQRFTFCNNYIANLLSDRLKKNYKIDLNPEFRFGYVNLFLVELAKIHKDEIKDLHQWTDV
jgi:hypothetical protein